MESFSDMPHISWLILVYDRTAEERFPLKRKWYVFSYERASEEEIQKVVSLCSPKKEFSPPIENPKLGDFKITYSIGARHTNLEILKYRHLFDLVPDYGVANIEHSGFRTFRSVSLTPNSYFEDENEKPISELDFFDEEMQRRNGETGIAIIFGKPESIFRLDPVKPTRDELWRNTDSDIIDHFFKQYYFIRKSRWFKSPCSISHTSRNEYFSQLPIQEDCMAIILPFRQLYSNNDTDNLFNKVCNVFKRHCPKDHQSFLWIEQYQKDFNLLLEEAPSFPLHNCEINRRRYLNAFAYGAKVVHVKGSNSEPSKDFEYLCNNFRLDEIVMQYHLILNDLMNKFAMVVDLLRKNFGYWVNDLGWKGPSEKPSGSDVFSI